MTNPASNNPQLIYIDNCGAISIAHNPRHHDRTNVRHHFICEAIEEDRIELQYVKTEDNIADLLTKPLPRPRHELYMGNMGVRGV